MRLYPLDDRKEWWLFSLIQADAFLSNIELLESTQRFWKLFQAFFQALQNKEINKALKIVLSATTELIGAEALCIYQADAQALELNLIASYGNCQTFPDKLTAQELTHLREAYTWTSAKRAVSALHQVARMNGWENLTTLPIGEPNATIGLFVAASNQTSLGGIELHHLQLLANFCTSLIQKHSQLSSLTQTLKALKEENRRLLTIEQAIDEGIIVLTPDLKIITMNTSAESILGYDFSETSDQPGGKIIISDREFSSFFRSPSEDGKILEYPMVKLYHRSGKSFPAVIKTIPITDGDLITAWIFIFHDLTEEENMRVQVDQLHQQAVLGQFQTDFAHEVRNPINNISTGLQLMALNLPSDDPNQDAITRLKHDCDRLTELMNTILSYTWTSQNEMNVVELSQLVERVIDRFKPKLTQTKIKLHIQIDDTLPPVWGNRRALEQIYINLIDNAIRIMKDSGGTLGVKVLRKLDDDQKDIIETSITDTGAGIPKEEKERMFQPYFTTSKNGTGLGLAISKKIISAHNGTIVFDTFSGGTIFYIRLPVYQPTQS
jgi:two-component system sensor histidine kinase AtoS